MLTIAMGKPYYKSVRKRAGCLFDDLPFLVLSNLEKQKNKKVLGDRTGETGQLSPLLTAKVTQYF